MELEYMIVDLDTLNVRPIADELIHDVAGEYVNEIEQGEIAWSNELVMHVVELKTNGPARTLEGLDLKFQEQVKEINQRLKSYNACLMPTAMHPWMNPYRDMKLWPHEYNPIYEAYNRIFDCRGHGWANLQSTHINLPFSGDQEFEKLHAAIRVLLPILPGLAASSPIADRKLTSYADYRMEVYRTNSNRIPSVTGYVIPEAVFTREEYDREIFQRIYNDIDPFDPEKILQDEWLNSRGAIARFDRGSIEIRVLDVQECPLADLAIVNFIVDCLNALLQEQFSTLDQQKNWNEKSLYKILLNVIKDGERAIVGGDYLRLFGLDGESSLPVSALWKHIFWQLYEHKDIETNRLLKTMQRMLDSGTLSKRISKALTKDFSDKDLINIYRTLCKDLSHGEIFKAV